MSKRIKLVPMNSFPCIPWEYKLYSGIFKIRRMVSEIYLMLILVLLVMPTLLYRQGVRYPTNQILPLLDDPGDVWACTLVIAGAMAVFALVIIAVASQSSKDMILYLQYKLKRTGEIESLIESNDRYAETREADLDQLYRVRNMYQEMLNDLNHFRKYQRRVKEAERALTAIQSQKPRTKKQEKEPYAV